MFVKYFPISFVILLIKVSDYGAKSLKVPDGLQFGVSTAAFQIEGGWDEGGKGESVWDRFGHEHPEKISGLLKNGDVTCDSYHKWREDVQIMKDMGVNFYRFSISWPRILPDGLVHNISAAGVKYYNDLIDALLEANIQPLVTLYHWDLPQKLQELGGWTNELTASYLMEYARLVFSLYGDRVKNWITINEPISFCEGIYEKDIAAPSIISQGVGTYLCGKTVLLANAKMYHVYDKEFRKTQNGTIGISLNNRWAEPATNSSQDIEAAEREMQMKLGWFAHPIFSKNGDYPEVMKQVIANRSRRQGFVFSRLPSLTEEEIRYIKGTADFFGINNYNTWLVSDTKYPDDSISFEADRGTSQVQETSGISPMGFRKLLNWIKVQYDNPLTYVTENGYQSPSESLRDTDRVNYLKNFITSLTQAIEEDGCNITRYAVWSIIDNFEWRSGVSAKFGLYHVDFTSTNRTRTPKLSASFYKNLIANREF